MMEQERPAAPIRPGSVVWGLVQSFGVYVLGATVLARTTDEIGGHSTWFEPILAATFAASVGLGAWHGVRGRGRTAVGAIIGSLLWPVVGCALVAWVFSRLIQSMYIPW